MDLILTRKDYTKDGIFGELTDAFGNFVACTLEHGFPDNDNNHYVPKLPPGSYVCTLGTHRLHDLVPFQTFEVMNVPPFQGKPVTGILFHQGNYNQDSDGCILLGSERNGNMIMDSKATLSKFLTIEQEVDSFTLTVI